MCGGFFLLGWIGSALVRGAWTSAAPLCQKEPVEMLIASYWDTSWPPSFGGFLGMSNLETCWIDYTSPPALGCFEIHQEELESFAGETDV